MRSSIFVWAALGVGCGSPAKPASTGPEKVDIPYLETPRPSKAKKRQEAPKQAPPPSAAPKESKFPGVERSVLGNGMKLAVVTAKAMPVVHVRVLLNAGDGFGAPGVAYLTAQLAKDGGTRAYASADLMRRIESLGANLAIATDLDSTVLSTAVTKDQLGEAISLLSQVLREPRFDENELRKLKTRATDDAEERARSDGWYTGTRTIFHELFPEKSPYAEWGILPSAVGRIDGQQIRDFHRRFWIPKSAELVLAGDVEPTVAKTLAEENFGRWTGGDPQKVDFVAPHGTTKTHVIVAHRAKSAQSDVFVASLAPERKTVDWPATRVAVQVLGGGVSGRLFADVREKRSLAYRTMAQVLELAHGSQPLVLYAGTETAKTGQAVSGLLENLSRMTSAPPTDQETDAARRYLSDIFAVRMETVGSIADMIVQQDKLGLPDGHWDAYRKELRAVSTEKTTDAAKKLYAQNGYLVVVAGDADAVTESLAKFGDVTVIDPEKEFRAR